MNAFNNITYGVYVLTSKTDKYNGCIINTLMQVTSNPEQISVCVNKENYTTKMIEESGVFNVSILDQTTTFDIIKHFGFSSGKDTNKFADFSDFKLAQNQIPYITRNTNAFLSGKVSKSVDLGSHILFVADVTEKVVLSSAEPLTYSFYHSNVKPKQSAKKNSYVCKICGYVHEGDELPNDFICPICKHGVEAFEKIETVEKINEKDKTTTKETATSRKTYYCPICGYTTESDTRPDKCLLCGAEMFEKK